MSKYTLKDVVNLSTYEQPMRAVLRSHPWGGGGSVVTSRVVGWETDRHGRPVAVCLDELEYRDGDRIAGDHYEIRAEHLKGKNPTHARVGVLLARSARDYANGLVND